MKQIINNFRFVLLILSIITKEFWRYIFTRNKNIFFINFIESLSKENIFYVKLFQIFGTNTKYFNKATNDYLIKYLDNVPFNKGDEKIEEVYNTIDKISIKYPTLTIDKTTLTQISSGIIAIVYKAKMSDKDIVIKVIKNNINEKVRDALNIFYFIILLIYKLPFLKYYYFMDIFTENKKLMLDQLNFNKEFENLIKFQVDNKNTNYIIIPKAYGEFTTENSNILVMNYLDGNKIIEILEEDKLDYINLLITYSIKSILFNRRFHADLHAGNMIFMNENNNNKIGIIDFGIVGTLTKKEQNNYYYFFYEIFKNKCYINAAKIIIDNFTIKINNNKEVKIDRELYSIVEIWVMSTFNKSFNLDTACIYKLNSILYTYNLKISSFLCKLELSLAIGDTVVQYLMPNKNFMDLLDINVNKLINNLSIGI